MTIPARPGSDHPPRLRVPLDMIATLEVGCHWSYLLKTALLSQNRPTLSSSKKSTTPGTGVRRTVCLRDGTQAKTPVARAKGLRG